MYELQYVGTLAPKWLIPGYRNTDKQKAMNVNVNIFVSLHTSAMVLPVLLHNPLGSGWGYNCALLAISITSHCSDLGLCL